jgi:endonuclease/exonuclease/phosphatase family metal-dependent hydrolase
MKRALSLLAFALVLAGCSTTKAPGPDSKAPSVRSKELKILTYNIHHGEGVDGKLDLARIAGIITNSGADLVALQEVDRLATRSGKVDQAAELGRLAGLHHSFGAAMPFQGGYYGQAILSRFPISATSVHPLPQQSGREPRIAVAAQIENLWFVSTHLDHQIETIRVQQAYALQKLFGDKPEPVILVGDFNASPTNETMQVFSNWLDAAGPNGEPTIPSDNPRRRIDYILLNPPARFDVLESKVLNEPIASDHRPVFARVKLKRP